MCDKEVPVVSVCDGVVEKKDGWSLGDGVWESGEMMVYIITTPIFPDIMRIFRKAAGYGKVRL